MRRLTTAALAIVLALFVPKIGQAQPTVDGDLSESDYNWIVRQDNASGFGGSNVVDSLGYAVVNGSLYIAQAGVLDGNGYGLWINVKGVGGEPAGNSLGISSGSKSTEFHFLDGNSLDGTDVNRDYKADFEVDIATAAGDLGTIADSTEFNLADYRGSTPSLDSLGRVEQGASANTALGGAVEFAHVNTGDADTGVEWKFELSALGLKVTDKVELSTFVVSGTAYFSDVVIPGDGTTFTGPNGPNAAFDANFNTIADTTGETFHTGAVALPVELTSFNARKNGMNAVLNWKTTSETNNSGFAVQHAVDGGPFEKAGWVDGAGTTTEAQDYRFSLEGLSAGTHRFRLKQVDLDGTTNYSETVSLAVQPKGPVAVQAAPHPVQQTSTVRLTTKETGSVTVALYDLLGRRVETLHQGRVAANQPETFSVDGSSLAAGTYFLRVRGESFTQTKRITVAR